MNILLNVPHIDGEEVWLGTSSGDVDCIFKVWGLARHLETVLPRDRDSSMFSRFQFVLFFCFNILSNMLRSGPKGRSLRLYIYIYT